MDYETLKQYVEENGKPITYSVIGPPASGKGDFSKGVWRDNRDICTLIGSGDMIRAESQQKDLYPEYAGFRDKIMQTRTDLRTHKRMDFIYKTIIKNTDGSSLAPNFEIQEAFNEAVLALINLGYFRPEQKLFVDGMSRTGPQVPLFDELFNVRGQIVIYATDATCIERKFNRIKTENRVDDKNGEAAFIGRINDFYIQGWPAIVARDESVTRYVDGNYDRATVRKAGIKALEELDFF